MSREGEGGSKRFGISSIKVLYLNQNLNIIAFVLLMFVILAGKQRNTLKPRLVSSSMILLRWIDFDT